MTLLRLLTALLLLMAVLRGIWWLLTDGSDSWFTVPSELREFVVDVAMIAIGVTLLVLGCLWVNDWIWRVLA